jgi:hypothetical protein
MTRLLAALLTLVVAAVAVAQPATPQPKDDPLDRSTFKLSTTPAAAPVPASKYEFRVRQLDRLPGNAALDYLRAALLVPDGPRDAKEGEKLHAKLDAWEATPLDELPIAEVTAYLDQFAGGFEALDAGARREVVDWRQGVPLTQARIGDHLREIQRFREIARLNGLRVRRDLARNEFEAAAKDLRSGFRLAQAVGEGPVVIQLLVGVSIGVVTVGQADRFVGCPGAPNLYHALAGLPRPLIDPRPALEGEAMFADRALKESVPLALGGFGRYRPLRDDLQRAFGLPYHRAAAVFKTIRERAVEMKKNDLTPAGSLFELTIPALEKTYHGFARLDRRMAGLTAVEAVRLHAAGNKGTPPSALADITAVSVPSDPFTARPFEYAARADGFTLTAPEDSASPGSGFRYVVTFR